MTEKKSKTKNVDKADKTPKKAKQPKTVAKGKKVREDSKISERIMNSSKLNKKNLKILKNRAKELSEITVEQEMSEDFIELVEFVLAYEQYGIASSFIREVFSMKEFTPIPSTPNFVLGVINVRGQIISVIDIKKFFGLPTGGISDLNRVVICHTEDMEVGILADSIKGVRIVPVDIIQASMPTLNDARAEYIKGVTEEGLVVLDIKKLLSSNKLVVYDEIEA